VSKGVLENDRSRRFAEEAPIDQSAPESLFRLERGGESDEKSRNCDFQVGCFQTPLFLCLPFPASSLRLAGNPRDSSSRLYFMFGKPPREPKEIGNG